MVTIKKTNYYTDYALKSFFKNIPINDDDDFFLIDNDGCETSKFSTYGKIKIIENNHPLNFAENVNQIIDIAIKNKKNLIFLTNDLVFTEDWIKPVLLNSSDISIPSNNQIFQYQSDCGNLKLKVTMDSKDFNENYDLLNDIVKKHKKKFKPNQKFQTLLMPFSCFKIPYDILKHKGFMRNIIIKHPKYSNEVMVNIVTAYEKNELLNSIVSKVQKISSNIKSIINTINNKKSDISYGMPKKILYGEKFIVENLNEFEFEISADSFFQTNSIQALKMYEHIKSESKLTGDEIIYDFYCGTGTISIFLSKAAKKVYGFEIVESAINDAKKNAKKNNVKNCEFYCSDLSKMTLEHTSIIENNACDVLVIDPPRAGVHPKTLKQIIKLNPKKIIYASCNPSTQSRDVRELINSNYIMGCVQPIDMFPHTHHIECVITLDKKI